MPRPPGDRWCDVLGFVPAGRRVCHAPLHFRSSAAQATCGGGALPTSLFAPSFPLTPACPGQSENLSCSFLLNFNTVGIFFVRSWPCRRVHTHTAINRGSGGQVLLPPASPHGNQRSAELRQNCSVALVKLRIHTGGATAQQKWQQ